MKNIGLIIACVAVWQEKNKQQVGIADDCLTIFQNIPEPIRLRINFGSYRDLLLTLGDYASYMQQAIQLVQKVTIWQSCLRWWRPYSSNSFALWNHSFHVFYAEQSTVCTE